jgi:putative peptidoglycan lipid II flippase
MMALVTVPASLGLLALRRPIIQLLFQQGEFDAHSTDLTSLAVLFHSMGIYFIASSRSLNQTFYAMKDLKTPMVVAAIAMGVNIGGCYGLAIPLGHGGIALANSLSALVTSALLFLFLYRRGVEVRFQSHAWLLLRLLVAGGIMVMALLALSSWLPQAANDKLSLALHLLLLVAAGAAVFLLAARLVARKELLRLLLLVTRKEGRGDPPAP